MRNWKEYNILRENYGFRKEGSSPDYDELRARLTDASTHLKKFAKEMDKVPTYTFEPKEGAIDVLDEIDIRSNISNLRKALTSVRSYLSHDFEYTPMNDALDAVVEILLGK